MPYNEAVANRVREALIDHDVQEKEMFRGVCFMVNGKMCICVNADQVLCRIGPDGFEEELEKEGVNSMMRNGKALKDYVFVDKEKIQTKSDFEYWVNRCLSFNSMAKATKKKK